MKKILITVSLFVAASFAIILSCKKDNSTTTPTPTSVICDGNGKATYYPLDSANQWQYEQAYSTLTPTAYVSYHTTYNGKSYAVVVGELSALNGNKVYLREDASTHNTYKYNNSNNTEYLEIPGSPVLNQSWQGCNSRRKVTGLSVSLVTPACSYTGLLEISDTLANVPTKNYYKKGLGLVGTISPSNDGFKLMSATIK